MNRTVKRKRRRVDLKIKATINKNKKGSIILVVQCQILSIPNDKSFFITLINLIIFNNKFIILF
jgi:hypothetical protein